MTSRDLLSDALRPAHVGDRRSNLALRALIDEMLERVRAMNRNADRWTSDARARAEAELEAVMARVRRVAAQQRGF